MSVIADFFSDAGQAIVDWFHQINEMDSTPSPKTKAKQDIEDSFETSNATTQLSSVTRGKSENPDRCDSSQFQIGDPVEAIVRMSSDHLDIKVVQGNYAGIQRGHTMVKLGDKLYEVTTNRSFSCPIKKLDDPNRS